MSTKIDPLNLLKREHFTAPTGRVESRSSPASTPTDDAAALVAALDDVDEELSDELAFQVCRELGYSTPRTLAAIRSALRAGLIAPWDE